MPRFTFALSWVRIRVLVTEPHVGDAQGVLASSGQSRACVSR
jgi:hypothetical protein